MSMMWILKSTLLNPSKFFANWTSNSNESSSSKRSRCGYNKLPGDEDNNNQDDESPSTAQSFELRHNKGSMVAPPTSSSIFSFTSSQRSQSQDMDNEDVDFDDVSDSLSDSDSDEDDDDRLTCWVCDRTFINTRLLERHKRRERHFGCGTCEAIFPTLMALESHREETDHWSDEDDDESGQEVSDLDDADDFSDDDIDDRRSGSSKRERSFLL